MEKKTASAIMLTLLLTSILTLAFNINPIKASGIIYLGSELDFKEESFAGGPASPRPWLEISNWVDFSSPSFAPVDQNANIDYIWTVSGFQENKNFTFHYSFTINGEWCNVANASVVSFIYDFTGNEWILLHNTTVWNFATQACYIIEETVNTTQNLLAGSTIRLRMQIWAQDKNPGGSIHWYGGPCDGVPESTWWYGVTGIKSYYIIPYLAPQYTITISAQPGGTTDPAPGTYSDTANSTVQVSAIPNVDYSFDHWELDTINVGSTNPYTILMDSNHTLKAAFTYSPPSLSASINPLSASILVGQSVAFASTVSGGYTPYSCQWYLDNNPTSGATLNTWTFTPTTVGNHTVHLNVTDNLGNIAKSNDASVTVAAQLTASISPMSASMPVGQSIQFTSTASGGYPPYSYQWYLNSAPISGATQSSWTFIPTTSGIYYVYIKITDSLQPIGNVNQSETARIAVTAVPVGGYSFSIDTHATASPLIPYLALVAILMTISIPIKRKTKRETK